MMSNEDFAVFYLKYHGFSIRVALNIVKNKATAEDITQEVFWAIYRMGEKLDTSDEKRLSSLIATVTANKAKDYFKKGHVKREIAITDEIAAETIADTRYNVEAQMLSMEEDEYAKMVLQKLRIENRMNYDILIKVKQFGISTADVAEEYGITRNNVNNRILRTKQRFKEEFAKLYRD